MPSPAPTPPIPQDSSMNELSEMFENSLPAPGPYNMSGILDLPLFSMDDDPNRVIDSDTASVSSLNPNFSQTLPNTQNLGQTAPLMIQNQPMYQNLPNLNPNEPIPGNFATPMSVTEDLAATLKPESLNSTSFFRSISDQDQNPFEVTLKAQTSPACKKHEETLTYLNQGQSYEVNLRRHEDLENLFRNIPNHQKTSSLLVCMRVVFHERRLQFSNQQHWQAWSERQRQLSNDKIHEGSRFGDNNRFSENFNGQTTVKKLKNTGRLDNSRDNLDRVLRIDIPVSVNVEKAEHSRNELNSATFVWDSSKPANVHVVVQCISTEFTQKGRGGEKGVPFRLHLDVYPYPFTNNPKRSPDNLEISQKLFYSCSCQIKVFKPKGADRKWKTDSDRMSKKTTLEKSKFRPGLNYTPMVKCPPLSDAKGMLVPPPRENNKSEGSVKVEKHSQSMEDIRPVGVAESVNLSGSCTNLSAGKHGFDL